MPGRGITIDTEPPIANQVGLLENRAIRTEKRDFLAALTNVENLKKEMC